MITNPRAVDRIAIRDSLGYPAITLLASMIGFGSLVNESGLPLGMAIAGTLGIWGLPGQLTLIEMHAAGASAFFVILGVALANARFLPMAVSFMPLMPSRHAGMASDFVLVQMLSINSWAAGLKRFPEIALGLIFMNPLFFAILLAGVNNRPSLIALLIGAPLGLFFHLALPDFDLLLTGIIGGSLAFWIGQRWPQRDNSP